jgi:hypothetical protein
MESVLKFRKRRGTYSFAVALVAALAFLVGALRFWDVPAGKVTSMLTSVVLMVLIIALLALATVAVAKLIRRWLGK